MDDKKQLDTIKDYLSKIDACKNVIAKERDKLREIYDDLETVLDSLDRGVEEIESGKRAIEDGIADLSEQL